MGHELTQRTFQTGQTRKVALPFLIIKDKNLRSKEFDPVSYVDQNFTFKNSELAKNFIVNLEGTKIGRVVAHRYNIGIGLFDINKLEDMAHRIEWDQDNELYALIYKPKWIQNYLPNKNPSEESISINPKEQLSRYQQGRQYMDQDEFAQKLKENRPQTS